MQLDLPVIRTALDLIEAEEKIAAGINDGKISPAEALQLQAVGQDRLPQPQDRGCCDGEEVTSQALIGFTPRAPQPAGSCR